MKGRRKAEGRRSKLSPRQRMLKPMADAAMKAGIVAFCAGDLRALSATKRVLDVLNEAVHGKGES